jgi:hypothetical protein
MAIGYDIRAVYQISSEPINDSKDTGLGINSVGFLSNKPKFIKLFLCLNIKLQRHMEEWR